MIRRPWLPEELKPYPVARAALGVVLSRPRENPEDRLTYEGLHDEKILKAIEQSRKQGHDPVDVVDTYLRASGIGRYASRVPCKGSLF